MEILLKNGLIVDGNKNSEIKKGSVLISEDKIEKIDSSNELENYEADEIFDIEGLYVSPGFIDVHSHSDLTLIAYPEAESAISQGVTTIISGNCGFSVCPVNSTLENVLIETKSYGIEKIEWSTVGQYLDYLEKIDIAVNYGYLVGHGQIRAENLGYFNKPVNQEIKSMERMLEKSLDEGAIGMSLGLIYIPGRFASLEELVKLSKVVKSRNKIVTVHMRSESAKLLEAIEESINIARLSEVNFQISHLKAAGLGKGKAFQACQMISEARKKGINIDCDQYPYNASNTGLSQVLPPHYLEGSIEEIIDKITKDPEKVASEIESYSHTPWDKILISEAYHPSLVKYLGLSIKDIAEDLNLPEALTVIKLMEIEGYDLGAIYFLMDQEEVDYIAKQDFVMVASDSAIRSSDSKSFPHPRTFGSFTKFINYYVKEKKV
ncbi:MAG: N-acyl-D-amino-acid deacylase family protein, partial [bacterium]